MFDPPIDNWTQADEDCYDCKHRLALGDDVRQLEVENARLRAALEPYADPGNWLGRREPYWNGPDLDAPWTTAKAALEAEP